MYPKPTYQLVIIHPDLEQSLKENGQLQALVAIYGQVFVKVDRAVPNPLTAIIMECDEHGTPLNLFQDWTPSNVTD
jgi:hypothetical protein